LFFGAEREIDLNEVYDTQNLKYKVRGLITILNNYKFTIAENTPIEEEVALDPELLGKVFENLLANYNPETKTTARKKTGSYYTPREIVNYMVDEALISYLKSKLEIQQVGFLRMTEDQPHFFGNQMRGGQLGFEKPLDDKRWTKEKLDAALRQLFSYSDAPHVFNEEETERLIQAIDDCTIIDPACGSGAFPMGVLQKLVHLLQKLDTDNRKWKGLQRQKALNATEEAFKIEDKEDREKRLIEINDIFEDNLDDYGRKLFLIENCIYGVDIQPIAIQIAKLRFFISLIVDQKENQSKTNLGIRPLPNLETKFVTANGLVVIESSGGLKPEGVIDLEKQLAEVRDKHFNARTRQIKEKYRDKDKEIRNDISKMLKQAGFPKTSADQIAAWNPYDQHTSANWFDAEWMFGIANGFDVVIGNPPYLNVEQVSREAKDYYAKHYKTFYKRYDVFGVFFEMSLTRLMKDRASLAFIIPSQIFNNLSYKKLRELMLSNQWLREVCYLGDKIFEAVNNDVCVLILQKQRNEMIRLVNALDFQNPKVSEVPANYFDKFGGVISAESSSKADSITDRIFNPTFDLIKKHFEVFQGIVTGNNEAFLPTNEQISEYRLEKGLLHSILLGRDFEKYFVRNEERQILYIDKYTDIEKYPNTKKWLSPFKDQLMKRRETRNGVIPWYALQWAREQALLEFTPKILVQRTRNPRLQTRIVATIDEAGLYGMESIIFLVPKTEKYSVYYLIAVLNSSLINYLYQTKFLNVSVKGEYLKDTPIPLLPEREQRSFEQLVKYMLWLKQQTFPDYQDQLIFSYFEQILDGMIYELYFPESLAKSELAFRRHLQNLPQLEKQQDKLRTLRELFIKLYQTNHPIRYAVTVLHTVPEVKVVVDNNKKKSEQA
jgi:hypothetical protein